jgi:hypothetical protein
MSKTIRSVYLHEHCYGCGGKVFRCEERGVCPQDDSGGEFFCVMVYDECCECGRRLRASGLVKWPIMELDKVMDRWENGVLNRADFDGEVNALLSQGSTSLRESG